MNDRLARPNTKNRPATEALTALEPVSVADPRAPQSTLALTLALRVGDRVARFDVRQFTPYSLIVEIRGASSGSASGSGWTPATLEISRSGPPQRFNCEIEFADWLAVSGNLDGPKLSAARLRLDCAPELRAELRRLYRQRLFPALFDPLQLPPELGVDAVYRAQDGALLGQIRVARAYSQTWMVHPLDRGVPEPPQFDDHDERDACQAALYQHFATVPALLDGHQQQWLIGYFDRRDAWNQLFFDAFVDWFDERCKAAVVGFDAYDVRPPASAGDSGSGSPRSSGADSGSDWELLPPTIEVDQVQPAELDRAVALIRAQLPEIACTALDIEAARLDRVYLHPDYAAHGIVRGRRVFVVRDARELVGVALCETCSLDRTSSPGALAGPLADPGDSIQLYARAGATIAAKRALIGFVRKHYSALGQPCPRLIAPEGSLPEPARLGLDWTGPIGCMIWSGQTLRAYRTFLRNAFARVADSPRKRRRHTDPGPKSVATVVSAATADVSEAEVAGAAEVRARLEVRLAPLLGIVQEGSGPQQHQAASELLGFLLHVCALGLRMSESLEALRRGAAASGDAALIHALERASDRELERSRLLLDDLFELGQRWREQLGVRINVELLVQQPPPRSLLRWSELLARQVRHGARAGVVSLEIEREIARVWAQLGPALLDRLQRFDRSSSDLAGSPAAATRWLSMVATETSATWFIERSVEADPDSGSKSEVVVKARRAALEAYLDVLCDCVELGRELAARVHKRRRTRGHASASAFA